MEETLLGIIGISPETVARWGPARHSIRTQVINLVKDRVQKETRELCYEGPETWDVSIIPNDGSSPTETPLVAKITIPGKLPWFE